jgi:hypothetical protein
MITGHAEFSKAASLMAFGTSQAVRDGLPMAMAHGDPWGSMGNINIYDD